jgi:hypothetical protein
LAPTTTDTIPTRTTTTTTTMAAATSSVAACIPATAGGFVPSKSANEHCSPKRLTGVTGGSCLIDRWHPLRAAQSVNLVWIARVEEALSRKEGHVGAAAFSRTGDPATGFTRVCCLIASSGSVAGATGPSMSNKPIKVDPSDGLLVDEVGPWASEKHDRLKRYIAISKGPRAKFLRKPNRAPV